MIKSVQMMYMVWW